MRPCLQYVKKCTIAVSQEKVYDNTVITVNKDFEYTDVRLSVSC